MTLKLRESKLAFVANLTFNSALESYRHENSIKYVSQVINYYLRAFVNLDTVPSDPTTVNVSFQMNTILGFKNLSEEDLEDNPCPVPLRDKLSEFHDSLLQVMSISSLEEEEVEIEPKSNERPSVLSVILKVS